MIWRGPLIGLAGLGCLLVTAAPTVLFNPPPPLLLRLILFGFAIVLSVGGVIVGAFERRQRRTLRTASPVPVQFTVEHTSDSESTTYTARIEVAGTVWLATLAANDAVRALARQSGLIQAEAWCEPESLMPMGLAVNGQRLRIIPHPRKARD